MSFYSDKIQFKGPMKRIKSSGEIRPIQRPDILSATMKFRKHAYSLYENSLSVSKTPNGNLMFYHSFEYSTRNGSDFEQGRWYDSFSTVELAKIIKGNTLRFVVKEYEHDTGVGKAEFTLVVSDSMLHKIMKL